MSSAEIPSTEVYHRFKEEFGVEVLDGTGSTEICHIFLSNRFGQVKPVSTVVGRQYKDDLIKPYAFVVLRPGHSPL